MPLNDNAIHVISVQQNKVVIWNAQMDCY